MGGQQPGAVLDHLDEVIGAAALLPAGQRVQVLDVAVSRLQAEQASALRTLEAEGGLAGSGCTTAGSWARLHLRRDHGAHRIVRRGRLLPQLPGFAAAFAAGQVTDEHVDTLLRWTKPCGMETLQNHEDVLLTLALQSSPHELGQALDALADLAHPDRDEESARPIRRLATSTERRVTPMSCPHRAS
ncbi:MAG TPA: DUF222 domain-containing protein [Nocardioidaceae bacterium]|nr:DUF222 domain-containing protein [Nocardioidaceae bacterium]